MSQWRNNVVPLLKYRYETTAFIFVTTIYIWWFLFMSGVPIVWLIFYMRVWIWNLYQLQLYWQQLPSNAHNTWGTSWRPLSLTMTPCVKFHFHNILSKLHWCAKYYIGWVWCWTTCVVDVVMFCHYSSGWTNVSNPWTLGYWKLVIIIKTWTLI